MSLVVFTGLCGLLAAPGCRPSGARLRRDPVHRARRGRVRGRSTNGMRPTSTPRCGAPPSRPLPAGRMDRQTALHFGVGLAVFSVVLMDVAANHLAAALLAVSILFYVLVYTVWLKRRTAQNIVIGGAAGAFPPLIGWVAATGRYRAAAGAAVRDHLPVDAAAFLGAVAVRALGLCRRRSADAAGRRRGPSDPPPDLALQPADGRRGDCAVAAWGWPGRSTASVAAALSARLRRARRAGARQPRDRAGRDGARRSGCSHFSILYLFALFGGAGRRPLGGA